MLLTGCTNATSGALQVPAARFYRIVLSTACATWDCIISC
jgi:hypothetical protein